MLHILPFTMDGKSIGYIYGVATTLEERGKGHATMLMERAIEVARKEGYYALVTIPADRNLRNYYEKFGFCGAYKSRFEMPDGFDPGTGDKKSDLISILPLKDIALPVPHTTLTLVWDGQWKSD
jgi:GNAT superfamily N-acetyltransferase